jgi:hypothetical protein
VESARAEIPLLLRITEFAFEHAKRAKDGTGPEELAPERIQDFLAKLGEEGLPAEILQDPEAQAYLSWRVRLGFAQRAEHYHHALEFQAERDRVLAEAFRFLEAADSQMALFSAVESQAERARRAQASGVPSGE